MRIATSEIAEFLKDLVKTQYKVTFVGGVDKLDINRLTKPIVVITPQRTELRTVAPAHIYEVQDTFTFYIIATTPAEKQTVTEGVVNLLLNAAFNPNISGIQPKLLQIGEILWVTDTDTTFEIAQVTVTATYLTP